MLNIKAKISVFLLALSVRAIFLVQWIKTPFFHSLQTDATAYQLWALEILKNGIWRDTAFYQSPFYPYLLALLYKIFGVHLLLISIIQIFLDATTCVIIYSIAKKLFGDREALCAGIISALYAPFIFFSVPLLKEVWIIFCLAVFIRLLLETEENDKAHIVFFTGVALGFCALSRGQALLFAPTICIYWLLVKKHLVIKKYLFFILGFCLTLLPVTLHNYIVSNDFVLINYTSGFSFFIGNNPEAEIWINHPLGISSSPLLEEKQAAQMAEKMSGGRLKPSQISAFWHRQSLNYILSHPMNWLLLTARKFIFFWNRVDIPDNYSIAFFKNSFATILDFPLFSFAVVAALGIAGMALSWGRSSQICLMIVLAFIYMGAVVLCVVSTRYRLPMAFFLILFASAAIFKLWDQRQWRKLIVAVPFWIFILLPPPFNRNLLNINGTAQLVMVYYDNGQFEQSAKAMDKLLGYNTSGMAPEIYIRGAMAYEKTNDFNKAAIIYQKGIAAHPENFVLPMAYGVSLYNRGKNKAAIKQFERACQLRPDSFNACKYLAIAYLRQHEYARAAVYADKALQINPQDNELKNLVGDLGRGY